MRLFSFTYFETKMEVFGLMIISVNLFRNILGQLAEAMPQAITVTPEEREAIQRVSLPSLLLDNQNCFRENSIYLYVISNYK